MQQMTIPTLMEILDRAGGADESVDLAGAIDDRDLVDLGYESLAILEAAGLIEREYGVSLDEEALSSAGTPRELVLVVNEALAGVHA